jgi:hypothetical protein
MYLGRQFGACRVVGGPDEPARARHICEIWDVCLRAVSATRRSWLHAKTLCMFLSCFALSKRFTCTCIIPICAVTPLKISFTPPSFVVDRGPQISSINCDHAAPKLCEIINEISGCNGYHQPNQSSKFREIPRRCLRKFGERERAEACGRVLGLAWVRAGSGRESRGVLGRGRRSHLACVFSALL